MANIPRLILIGAGGHARSSIDVIEQQGHFKIAGLVGLLDQKHSKCLDYEVIWSDEDLPGIIKNFQHALITVGQIKTSEHRLRLYNNAKQLGFQLPVIISPTAYVSRYSSLGAGTIVMHGAIVNSGSNIGNNCIINSSALIEHDVIIKDQCHIATGAILNGNVTVGAGSFIGSGCVIKQGLTIGERCVVGMGLTLRHNLIDNTCFTGYFKA